MKKVIVCTNHRVNPAQPSCAGRNSREIADLLEQGIAEQGLAVELERFKCLGRCELGPNLKMAPDGKFYNGVKLSDVPTLLETIRTCAENSPPSGYSS